MRGFSVLFGSLFFFLPTSYDPATNGSTIRESAVTRRNPVSTTPDFSGWCARAAPHQPQTRKNNSPQNKTLETLSRQRERRECFVFCGGWFCVRKPPRVCANRPDSRVRKPRVFLTRFSDPSETPEKPPFLPPFCTPLRPTRQRAFM